MVRAGYKQTEVGEIPEDWEVVPLIRSCKIIDGDRGSNYPSKQDLTDNGHCLFLNAGNVSKTGLVLDKCEFISSERDQALNNGKLKRNDVVLTTRGTIGNIGYYTIGTPFEHVRINSGMVIIRNEDKALDSDYLHAILNSPFVSKQVNTLTFGSAQPQLTVKDINTFKIFEGIDPVEQKAIATALSDVDVLIGALEKQIAKKRDIKTATMQQLLTGKKRLPGFGEGKGYKQTELGMIPEDWGRLNVGEDATLNARIGWQALTTTEYEDAGEYFLVTGTDFIGGHVNWDTCHFVSKWRYSQDRKIQLMNGDVLITKDGTIGKAGFVAGLRLPATLNSGVFVIRPADGKFFPKFLYYILTSRVFDEFLSKITAGSTITHLYQKDFVHFEFYAPEPNEQEAIADILGTLDTEYEKLKTKLTKTKAIKQGMMQELLTGRTRLV